jgi:16S rRNA (cytosine967-C5)-methyltransferase
VIHSKKNFRNFPAYKNGLFEVQDVSSQLVAPMLDAQPGMLVIDGCAGAGGKTLHIAALMQNKGEILAVDVNEKKLEQLPVRASRAGINTIEPFAAEQLTLGTQTKLRNAVDRILLDVPCSGLGVLRRKPDAKWSLSLQFIKELVQRQADILDKYAPMLKPEGILVYSTCSILPMENEKQVQSFLERQNGIFELLEEKRVSPAQTGFDGFYMAKLKRKS